MRSDWFGGVLLEEEEEPPAVPSDSLVLGGLEIKEKRDRSLTEQELVVFKHVGRMNRNE